MATIYVDSAAVGSNNGTSWANAYTSIEAAGVAAAAAGTDIYVSHAHQENKVGNISVTFANGSWNDPIRVYSVNKGTGAYATMESGGGYIQTSVAHTYGINIYGSYHLYGLLFNVSYNITFGSGTASAHYVYLQDCKVIQNRNQNNSTLTLATGYCSQCICQNCTFDWSILTSISNGSFAPRGFGSCTGCTFIGPNTGEAFLFGPTSYIPATWTFDNCTISGYGYTIYELGKNKYTFRNCTVPAWIGMVEVGNDVSENGVGHQIDFFNCKSGTLTTPVTDVMNITRAGTTSLSLSRYRTGGSFDGYQANPFSYALTSTSDAKEFFTPHVGPAFQRWVIAGAAITITVYFASGVTLEDDEFWIVLLGPSDSVTPTASGHIYTSRMAVFGTPAALTTDSASTWNGTGVGTKQKITYTYTPTISGWLSVRPFLAKPSTTVYVDPKIEVTY